MERSSCECSCQADLRTHPPAKRPPQQSNDALSRMLFCTVPYQAEKESLRCNHVSPRDMERSSWECSCQADLRTHPERTHPPEDRLNNPMGLCEECSFGILLHCSCQAEKKTLRCKHVSPRDMEHSSCECSCQADLRTHPPTKRPPQQPNDARSRMLFCTVPYQAESSCLCCRPCQPK